MIKYHVLALLSLVAAAISAVEFLAISMVDNPTGYLSDIKFWLMVIVFGVSITLYFRVKRERKNKIG